jgi:hypothetical protein
VEIGEKPIATYIHYIHYGQVKIIKISSEKSNVNLTKIIWVRPKQFVPVQNNLHGPKSFWSYKGQGMRI